MHEGEAIPGVVTVQAKLASKGPVSVNTGANASKEESEEGVEDSEVKVVDLKDPDLGFGYEGPQAMSEGEFNSLYKAWCKAVKEKIESKGGKPKDFMQAAKAFLPFMKANFSSFEIYYPKSFNSETFVIGWWDDEANELGGTFFLAARARALTQSSCSAQVYLLPPGAQGGEVLKYAHVGFDWMQTGYIINLGPFSSCLLLPCAARLPALPSALALKLPTVTAGARGELHFVVDPTAPASCAPKRQAAARRETQQHPTRATQCSATSSRSCSPSWLSPSRRSATCRPRPSRAKSRQSRPLSRHASRARAAAVPTNRVRARARYSFLRRGAATASASHPRGQISPKSTPTRTR